MAVSLLFLMSVTMVGGSTTEGGAAQVLFKRVEAVAAPSTYGHITFRIGRSDLERKYEGFAQDIFQRYLVTIQAMGADSAALDNHKACLAGRRPCQVVDFLVQKGNVSAVDLDAAELRKLVHTVEHASRETVRMVFKEREAKGRHPRQIFEMFLAGGELVNFGLGVANRIEISHLSSEMTAVKQQMSSLIAINDQIFRTQVRDHQAIERVMNSTLALQKNVDVNRRIGVYISFKQALDHLLLDCLLTYQAASLLHQGTVSSQLLDYSQLEASFEEMKAKARAHRLKPVAVKADELLTQKATYWVNDEVLHFVLAVPLIHQDDELLTAYELIDRPTSVPDEKGLEVVFSAPHNYILVPNSRNAHFALTKDDWSDCRTMGSARFCPDVRLRFDNFDKTCIGALFDSSPKRKTLCQMEIRRAEPLEVRELGVGELTVTAANTERVTWRTECPGKAHNTTTTGAGWNRLLVPEGCTLYGAQSAYVYLPRNVEVNVSIVAAIQHEMVLPSGLEELFSTWEMAKAFLDEKDVAGYVTETRLADLKMQEDLRKLHAISRSDTATGLWVGLAIGILLAVGMAVAIFLWCKLRGRMTRMKAYHKEASVMWMRRDDGESVARVAELKIEEADMKTRDRLREMEARIDEMGKKLEDALAAEEERLSKRLETEAAKLEQNRAKDMRNLVERVRKIQAEQNERDQAERERRESRSRSKSRLSLVDYSLQPMSIYGESEVEPTRHDTESLVEMVTKKVEEKLEDQTRNKRK